MGLLGRLLGLGIFCIALGLDCRRREKVKEQIFEQKTLRPLMVYKEKTKQIILLEFYSDRDFSSFIVNNNNNNFKNVVALVKDEINGEKRYIFNDEWMLLWSDIEEGLSNEDFIVEYIKNTAKNDILVVDFYEENIK